MTSTHARASKSSRLCHSPIPDVASGTGRIESRVSRSTFERSRKIVWPRQTSAASGHTAENIVTYPNWITIPE